MVSPVGPDLPALSLNGASFAYGRRAAVVRGVSLTLRVGDYMGMVGANGSGKSTLAGLLSGALAPTAGVALQLGGQAPPRFPDPRAVAWVHAEPEGQLLTTSVFDEVAFALRAARLPPAEVLARTARALHRFDLEAYADLHPATLSAGEQLRTLVAAAMARRPRFLLLDEVAAMVDSRHWLRLLARLRRWCDRGLLGLLVITHRLEDVRAADRVVVIRDGQVVAEATPAEIYARAPDEPDWHVAVPLIEQVGRLLGPGGLRIYPELRPVASSTEAPSHVV